MKHQIYHHAGQPNMQVEVILASKGPDSPPVYTIRMRYPRIIHSEVMTHRVFNRNAGSSRAQPASVTIQKVISHPFVPWHMGKIQAGMQAFEENDTLLRLHEDTLLKSSVYANAEPEEDGWCDIDPKEAWQEASFRAADVAEAYAKAGYHKQVFNRLLEPFSWIDVLITATEWDNFLWLRNHEMAEPHLQDLAALVTQALMDHEDKIMPLDYDEWHIPYVTDEERNSTYGDAGLLMMSAGRCCRISYKPFGEDQINVAKDLQRFHQLTGGDRIHASPLEHQCRADKKIGVKTIPTLFFGESEPELEQFPVWGNPHLHGNLEGYVQFRKICRGERFGR